MEKGIIFFASLFELQILNHKIHSTLKQYLISILLFISFIAYQKVSTQDVTVQNEYELESAIKNTQLGDHIIMSNGIWDDIEIQFSGNGTQQNPMISKVGNPAQIIIYE